MWGAMATAACALMASACAEKETGITSVAMGARPRPAPTASAKCPCCGSRQFVTHQSRRVCSYCRSEQDGQQASEQDRPALAKGFPAQNYEHYMNRLSLAYGSSVLRPELAVRIPALDKP